MVLGAFPIRVTRNPRLKISGFRPFPKRPGESNAAHPYQKVANSIFRQTFKLFKREHIAAAQKKPGDLFTKLAVERGICLRQLHGDIPSGKAHQRGQSFPALLRELNIYLVLVGQQGAGHQFLFTGVHNL